MAGTTAHGTVSTRYDRHLVGMIGTSQRTSHGEL